MGEKYNLKTDMGNGNFEEIKIKKCSCGCETFYITHYDKCSQNIEYDFNGNIQELGEIDINKGWKKSEIARCSDCDKPLGRWIKL